MSSGLSKSSLLYTSSDSQTEDGGIVHKMVIWADDYIEIVAQQPSSGRRLIYKLPTALVSCFIQYYYFDLQYLWSLIANSVRFFPDRVLFSTEHILNYPIITDSASRPAYRLYETVKRFEESKDIWRIEILTNIEPPFDVEIRAKLSDKYERRFA